MPRKSTALRIKQGKEMLAKYEAEGIQHIWPAKKPYNFVSDMLRRLQAGRSWSKRQREYFDACVDGPIPVIESIDPEKERTLRDAAAILGPSDGEICIQFAQRLRSGKSLSPKQLDWANRCIEKAESIANKETFQPNEEQLKRMHLIVKLRRGYAPTHWYNCPSKGRALDTLTNFLNGNRSYITEDEVAAAEKAVIGSLRKIDNPRFSSGDNGWIRSRQWDATAQDWVTFKSFALICSDAYVSDKGVVVYDAIINGNLETRNGDSILKR